jgi:uncharacterized OsmC-like protein
MSQPSTQVAPLDVADPVERVRAAVDRSVRAISRRPAIARGTAVTRVRLLDGLACEVAEGDWRLTVDMSPKSGGEGRGPNPGVLGRGALGSCLAVGYVTWAARCGIRFSSLEVEIHADYDARGHYGIEGGRPGYGQIRYVVTVESEAPEAQVRQVLDDAEAHSDYLAVFAQPVDLRRELRVNAPAR